MGMEVSKGDVLAGFQQLFGNIMIPALQKQEVMQTFVSTHVQSIYCTCPFAVINYNRCVWSFLISHFLSVELLLALLH